VIDAVLWDLDDTLVPTSALADARHSNGLRPLASEASWPSVVPYAGMVETLTTWSGPSIGLVTSSPRWYVEEILGTHFPEVAFDCVITYDDVSRLKPDPEPVLLAVERLGAAPARTILIGDHAADQQACAAAGVRFLGAGWTAAPGYDAAAAEILRHPADAWAAASGVPR